MPAASMASLDPHINEAFGPPITKSEMTHLMTGLLDPLCSCLKSMEGTLQELEEANRMCLIGAASARIASATDAVTSPTKLEELGRIEQMANGSYEGRDNKTATATSLAAKPSYISEFSAATVRSKAAPFVSEFSAINAATAAKAAAAAASKARAARAEAGTADGGNSGQTARMLVGETPTEHSSGYMGSSTGNDWVERMHVKKALEDAKFTNNGVLTHKMVMAGDRILDWWNNLKRSERRQGCLFDLAGSHTFESTCISVIMLNSILVAYTLDWQIKHVGLNDPEALVLLDLACFIFFLLELLIRLGAHRLYFFVNDDMNWNIFDFTLVTISVVDFIMDKVMADNEGGGNVVFMRLLRLLKMARIFRSLRSFRFFKALASMMESFQKSMISLFWGFIMLVFVLYLFSLIFMQALIEYMSSGDTGNADDRKKIEDNFGSLGATLLSLYKSVTGGEDWAKYYDIVSVVGPIYSLLFLLFTFFFIFALFNIVTGTLVEKAIVSSKPDRTELILDQRRRFAEQKQEFLDICRAMDADNDGKISLQEFHECLCNPVMLAYMASIGIEVDDVELFFDTVGSRMDSNRTGIKTGEITIEHFVEGCMHMKGSATALDMQRQLFEVHLLHQDLRQFDNSLHKSFQHITHLVNQLHALQREGIAATHWRRKRSPLSL